MIRWYLLNLYRTLLVTMGNMMSFYVDLCAVSGLRLIMVNFNSTEVVLVGGSWGGRFIVVDVL